MKESNTQSEPGIPQGFRTGRQSMHLDRSDSASAATAGPLQDVEPLLDCTGAAAVLGGLHPKTVERWAREGRIPAYHYFRHWKFRASELEVWMLSHVNSVCHPCRLKQEESDGI
jgi:excisionase family DNA binding protein